MEGAGGGGRAERAREPTKLEDVREGMTPNRTPDARAFTTYREKQAPGTGRGGEGRHDGSEIITSARGSR